MEMDLLVILNICPIMVNYAQLLAPSFAMLLLQIPNHILAISSSPYKPKDYYLISCGLPYNKKSSPDGGTWRSDEDPTFSPSASAMASASASATGEYGLKPPYDTARIFHSPLSYSIPVSSPGPKLVRLYFSPNSSYNNIHPSNFYISLQANSFILLTNFSAYIAAANAKANPNYNAPVSDQGYGLVKEFYLTVSEAHHPLLNLTFSPHPVVNYPAPSFGFVNGIEIISAPNGLYVPDLNDSNQSPSIPHLQGSPDDYNSNFFNFSHHSFALELIIRLNVGGSDVSPNQDSGLNRTWYQDTNFLMAITGGLQSFTGYNTSQDEIQYTQLTPPYTAPKIVYLTLRTIGPYDVKMKLRTNLTWVFEVDVGFSYLVRLHFCELMPEIKQSAEEYFDIYINNQTAKKENDVFYQAGGREIPIYKDFVTDVDASSDDTRRGSRVHLWVTLHPDLAGFGNANAFLNGLEIFKLSNESRSLAAPNPSIAVQEGVKNVTPGGKRSHHWVVPIVIVGGVLGLVVVLAFALFLYNYCRRKARSQSDTSKAKWVPIGTIEFSSTTSSVASSLPSDLCRRFSLAQIRVATSDFDESSVIGTGGFGKVYKGVIDGGATTVAIKRLNPTSKQGAHEFRTEIEMLSRLRHLHLVSLIGYCEEHGEMILVYEYMPRGTLRDHLLYKNNNDSIITPLSWKQRLMICVGSARGLHYLHSGTKELIIHRDVKSTNILLDDKWTAKVSDFGLSKVGPASESGIAHVSTAVKGSIGYLDPEYYKRQRLTEKSDVYSFGVVLFEVLCARPAANPNLPKEQVNLAMWARTCYKKGLLHTIVDPKITGQIAPESLSKFGEIAEMCVRDEGSKRPLMGDVVWAVEFALELQETADKNNINSTAPLGGLLGPTIATKDGDGGTTTTDDIFSATMENLSNTSGTSVLLSNDHVPMRSGSIFSEIMDPQAR